MRNPPCIFMPLSFTHLRSFKRLFVCAILPELAVITTDSEGKETYSHSLCPRQSIPMKKQEFTQDAQNEGGVVCHILAVANGVAMHNVQFGTMNAAI